MSTTQRSLVEIHQPTLMREARTSLTGRWGTAVAAYIVFFLVSMVLAFIPLVPILITGPLTLGLAGFGLRLARDEHAEVGNIFDGFKNFGTALAAYIVMLIVVLLGFISVSYTHLTLPTILLV